MREAQEGLSRENSENTRLLNIRKGTNRVAYRNLKPQTRLWENYENKSLATLKQKLA